MTILKSINPANGELVGEVTVADKAEIDSAVSRARLALKTWRGMTLEERAACLKDAIPALEKRADELGQLISSEMGRPLPMAIGEGKQVATELGKKVDSVMAALQPHEINDGKVNSTFYYEPFGVCAAITPWNFPVNMIQWMIIPALMAGNTVIAKPSEQTPLCGQLYIETLQQFLPENVLQVVQGGKDTGRELVKADINLIAFTGSRRAGRQILEDAAKDFKRIILELGGKDPLLVMEDADIEQAVNFAAINSYFNSGQVCVSTERIYVHRAVADAFKKGLVERTAAINVVAGDQEKSEIGPMVAEFQREHVLRQLAEAEDKGATVLFGEKLHPEGYVMPTVLEVTEDMDIMQEETFGPVSCVSVFDDVEDVIEKINSSDYGLGAAIFSKDIGRAVSIARKIESGMIGINKGCRGAQGTPMVGAKQSGYNYHDGEAGHRNFAQVKIVSVPEQK